MAQRILFITLSPPKPSTKQRVLDSLGYLRDKGMICDVLPMPSGLFGRIGVFAKLKGYDVIFIQKKLLRTVETRLMSWLNPNIVFDLDDSIMFHEVERSEKLTGRFFARFIGMVNNSKAVLAGNRFLYEFCRYNNDNVHIVPTPINVSTYTPKDYSEKDYEVVIGWMGTKGNLKYLKELGGTLKELSIKYPNVRLKIISQGFLDLDGVQVIKKMWSQEEMAEDLRSLDIGIMPLNDDIWAKGKCGNKILQYFGVAVPVVASPVGMNSDIIEPGIDGFLAGKPKEWVEHLSYLIENRERRMEMGLNGRRKVLKTYSQEVHQEKLWSILNSIN